MNKTIISLEYDQIVETYAKYFGISLKESYKIAIMRGINHLIQGIEEYQEDRDNY